MPRYSFMHHSSCSIFLCSCLFSSWISSNFMGLASPLIVNFALNLWTWLVFLRRSVCVCVCLEISLSLKALGQELHLRPHSPLPLLQETVQTKEVETPREGRLSEWMFLSVNTVCFVAVRCLISPMPYTATVTTQGNWRLTQLSQTHWADLCRLKRRLSQEVSGFAEGVAELGTVLSVCFKHWEFSFFALFLKVFIILFFLRVSVPVLQAGAHCSALAVKSRPPPAAARLCEKPDSLFVSGTQSRALFRVWPTPHRPSTSPLKNVARQQQTYSQLSVSLAPSHKCF